MRWRLLAMLVFVLAPAAFVPGAAGYRVEGEAWPGGIVSYYNAAPDQAWAVAQAVRAWNTSGARVQFVSVPRQSAKLVIRSTESRRARAPGRRWDTSGPRHRLDLEVRDPRPDL